MADKRMDMEFIVRIIGKDLDGSKRISQGLQGIKGIGLRLGGIIESKFCKVNKIPTTTKLGELTKEQVESLEKVISNPTTFDLPNWVLNRQKDYDTNKNLHLTMNDLDFQSRNDFSRLAEIKSYKGLRHSWGLTVRGQKTKNTHRGKGATVVGVSKEKEKPATKK
ncbi:MAG: 30S ribosomal protein S13 [Candidatus ainarchaeum sp.]|nr:30S ribosomal protein S13 [Candidatus ainarchaeum sp.]